MNSRLVPRMLVVAPNWIGDALLAQPLFARLRERHPGVALDALCARWTAPVLRRMPELADIVEAPLDHGRLQLGLRWRLGRRLRTHRYEAALVLPNSFKSALMPLFAGIPRRVGFVGESRFGVLNVVHRLDEEALPLMAERYAQLAEPPGTPLRRPLASVRLNVDEANLALALARLGLDRTRPIVAVCPGAEYGPAKRWPTRHFATLARALAERGRTVWIVGSSADRPSGDAIAAAAPAAINLCGRTDLAAAIDLLSVAEVVVTNDSGLMHVARALRRPLVALYGSSSPEHTPPLAVAEAAATARLVSLRVECSPCFARVCPLEHFRCMNDLAPERVLAEVCTVAPALA